MSWDPLVSCLCVTEDREAFIPWLLWCFDRQTWSNRELVIIDSSNVPLPSPERPDVRVVHVEPGTSVGQKRNLAMVEARGEVLTWSDDDDWQHPLELDWLVDALGDGAPYAGATRAWFADLELARCVRHDAGGWILFNSAGFRREAVSDIPFDVRRRRGSDTLWMRAVRARHRGREVRVDQETMFFWLCHGGNLSNRTTHRRFRSPLSKLRQKVGEPHWNDTDRALAALRARLRDPPRDVWGHARRAGGVEAKHVTPSSHELPPEHPSGPRISVSIPYYRCSAYILRAVESVLAQTYENLVVVVLNDGDTDPPWKVLGHINDPRLVRFDLNANRGRYFADAVVLAATPDAYFLVQDADDWSEPERVASLFRRLREEHASAAVSAIRRHRLRMRGPAILQEETSQRLHEPLTSRLRDPAHHSGLYRVDRLQAIGGYYGGFRLGYDTLLLNLLLMTGRIAYADQLLYNRTIRPDSLTSAPETGCRSRTRAEVRRRLQDLYSSAFELHRRYLACEMDCDALAEQLRAVVGQNVSPEERIAIAGEADRLRAMLPTPKIAPSVPSTAVEHPVARKPVARPTGSEPTLHDLLDHPSVVWGDWAITRSLAEQLVGHLDERRPKRILDIGSGCSTVFLAHYAARHGAHVVSLEHARPYHARTQRLLEAVGLAEHVELRLAPLVDRPCEDGSDHPWYNTDLEGHFDFIFVDGPPGKHGRQAALFALWDHLAPGDWELWLHDGARPHEQACLELWRDHYALETALDVDADSRGVLRLTASRHIEPAQDPVREIKHTEIFKLGAEIQPASGNGLGISLLTGGRPSLFASTIESLVRVASDVLANAYVVALVNGDDPQTQALVDRLSFVDRCIRAPGELQPIGPATSRLMQALCSRDEIQYVLHIEDDWKTNGNDSRWLDDARSILDTVDNVGQVRLRLRSERVLPYHMVSKIPIVWKPRDGYDLSESAHFTFNPSLMRREDVLRVYPCEDETEAQVNFLRTGYGTAQLTPGVFCHLGGGQSLRAKTLRSQRARSRSAHA